MFFLFRGFPYDELTGKLLECDRTVTILLNLHQAPMGREQVSKFFYSPFPVPFHFYLFTNCSGDSFLTVDP